MDVAGHHPLEDETLYLPLDDDHEQQPHEMALPFSN